MCTVSAVAPSEPVASDDNTLIADPLFRIASETLTARREIAAQSSSANMSATRGPLLKELWS
jgi:hypothetical protein